MAEETVAPAREASEPRFPVTTARDAFQHLRRPFTPEAIKFKVQSSLGDTGALIVAYIDARLVIERLNLVCGPEWHATYRETGNPKLMWCDLTVFGRTRSDLGETTKTGLSKDLVSDSLKRAAVHFGVGVSVYALPQIRLYFEADAESLKKTRAGKPFLTDTGHTRLRGGYRKWLEREDNTFGLPLDHGDVEGQIDEPEDEDFVVAGPAPVEDDEATMLREKAQEHYDTLRSLKATNQTLAAFRGQLSSASWSHEELRRFVDHLAAQVAKAREQVAA